MNLDELERLEREATKGPWTHETNARPGDCAAIWHEHYVYAPEARYKELPGNVSPVKVAWLPKSATKRPAHDAAFIAAIRNAARELIADAKRYRWLRARFFGVDFGYDGGDDKSLCVVVFKIDDTTRVSGDLNASIDAAIAQEGK